MSSELTANTESVVVYHDMDAERALLGAIMIDGTALATVETVLRVEHFQAAPHRLIYAAMLAMAQASRVVDLVTVKAELEASGDLDDVGGVVYLASLTDGMPRVANVQGWARLLREEWRRKAVISIARQMIKHATESDMGADEIVERSQASLARLIETSERRIIAMRDVLPAALKDLEQFVTAAEGVVGIPTGLVDLDRCLGGLQPGRLYIVAARTSRGKSVLCTQISINAAACGKNTLVFSMEMEPYQFAERALLADAEVDRWDLKPDSPRADFSWAKVSRSYGRLVELPVSFDQSESPSLAQIRTSARQFHNGPGAGLIVVDYLQRMTLDPAIVKAAGQWAAVGELAKGLKSMARSLRVPVVAACQLSADAEEKRPTLAMLAQAQSIISAEADAIILLHPHDLKKWKTQAFPFVHFLVDKNRTGPCQDITVSFEKACSRFVSAAVEPGEEPETEGGKRPRRRT